MNKFRDLDQQYRLKNRVSEIGRKIAGYKTASTQRIRWAWRILQSDYPELLLDISLEERFAHGPFPRPNYLSARNNTSRLSVEGILFHWPSHYDPMGIGWVYREVFAKPEINPHAYEFKNVRMAPGSWVIDAGASEGFFVHYALLRGCNVLAVEPDPDFVSALQLTFEQEIADGKVRIIEGAVGNLTGTAWLKMSESDVFSSQVAVQGDVPVRVYTVDELVQTQGLGSLSFIKMDIEGAELYALEGARSVLNDHRPNLSIAVYHADSTALILKDILKRIAPHYRVRFRGAWLRSDDIMRPYMLMASPR